MQKIFVEKGRYVDSVTLMGVGERAIKKCHVKNAEGMMATPANIQSLQEMGYEVPEDVTKNDLLLAVTAETEEQINAAKEEMMLVLNGGASKGAASYRDLDEIDLEKDPFDLVQISLPGVYAAAEAKMAIEKGLEPDVKQAILDMGQTLKGLGAEVEEISLPFLDYVIPTYYIIAAAEASSNLSRFDGVRYGFRAEGYEDLTEMYSKTRSQGFGEEVKKRILLGTFVLSSGYYDAYYKKALQVKAIIKQEFDKIFSKYDAILLPAAPATAPKLGESLADPLKMYLSDIFTVSVNIAGLPGLSVPSGFDQAGMPVGTQIIGPALGDADVLNIGYAFQQATEYHKAAPSGKCSDPNGKCSGPNGKCSAPSGKCTAEKEVR